MAGRKNRLFLYRPAHRAQVLAKAGGGRVLALRKVGAELYLDPAANLCCNTWWSMMMFVPLRWPRA